MVEFDLWAETFIFASIFSVIVIVPCILVAIVGSKMIQKLGLYPTKTPTIQMSIFMQLMVIEVCTFGALFLFGQVMLRK